MSGVARRQLIFVGVFLIVVVLFVTTFRMGIVRGESMMPTYANGQVVLVRRRNGFSAPLRRNDVVLLQRGRDVLIKRIYRLPGEEIDDPMLKQYIRVMEATGGIGDYFEQQPEQPPRRGKRYFLPDGYIFVLGDNQRASEDSRQLGPIPIRDILGTVVAAPPPPQADALPSEERRPPLPGLDSP